MSSLLPLLARAGAPPPELTVFDEHARDPDDVETSVQVDARVHPWRLTHYYDARGRSEAVARVVGDRLRGLAAALSTPIPSALDRVIDACDPAIRQIAIGIDVRARTEETRLKHYMVLSGDGRPVAERACAALGVEPPPGAALDRTHIVGVDLTRDGLHDVKLYFAIEPSEVARTLRDPGPWQPLLRACRAVVFQHSLLVADKRSMHFQAGAPAALSGELDRLRDSAPATVDLLAHLRAIGPSLEPWIVSFPYRDGRLERGRFNVYLQRSRRPTT